MAHWSDRYLGIPYAALNCAELVEKVQLEQFGRRIRFPKPERQNVFHYSAAIVSSSRDFAEPVEVPSDGCAVLLFARGRIAHVGLYCLIGRESFLLHADSRFGSSCRIPMSRVQAPLYRLEGYYAWLEP